MIFLDNRPQKIFMFKSGFSTFFSLKDRFPGPVLGTKATGSATTSDARAVTLQYRDDRVPTTLFVL